jgi:hypothetical protein
MCWPQQRGSKHCRHLSNSRGTLRHLPGAATLSAVSTRPADASSRNASIQLGHEDRDSDSKSVWMQATGNADEMLATSVQTTRGATTNTHKQQAGQQAHQGARQMLSKHSEVCHLTWEELADTCTMAGCGLHTSMRTAHLMHSILCQTIRRPTSNEKPNTTRQPHKQAPQPLCHWEHPLRGVTQHGCCSSTVPLSSTHTRL